MLFVFLSFITIVVSGHTNDVKRLIDTLYMNNYSKILRPHYRHHPVVVMCSLDLATVSEVSEVDMDMTSEIYLTQYWLDNRVEPEEDLILTELNSRFLWRPDTFFPNSKEGGLHDVTQQNIDFHIHRTGLIKLTTRLTIRTYCPMDFTLFPLDNQHCNIFIESFSMPIEEAVYVWEIGADNPQSRTRGFDDDVAKSEDELHIAFIGDNHDHIVWDSNIHLTKMTQFSITGIDLEEENATRDDGRVHSRLKVTISMSRGSGYYFIQIYIPSSLLVVMSMLTFCLSRPEAYPARINLGVAATLAMTIALSTQNLGPMPRVSYFRAVDVYLLFCFVMIFLTLVESAFINYISSRKKTGPTTASNVIITSNNIDRFSQLAFPTVFFSFNIIYWLFYLSFSVNVGDM